MTKQFGEYERKAAVAAGLADDSWLSGGLDGMRGVLASLRRDDADPVVVAEMQRLYTQQMQRTLPAA